MSESMVCAWCAKPLGDTLDAPVLCEACAVTAQEGADNDALWGRDLASLGHRLAVLKERLLIDVIAECWLVRNALRLAVALADRLSPQSANLFAIQQELPDGTWREVSQHPTKSEAYKASWHLEDKAQSWDRRPYLRIVALQTHTVRRIQTCRGVTRPNGIMLDCQPDPQEAVVEYVWKAGKTEPCSPVPFGWSDAGQCQSCYLREMAAHSIQAKA